MTISFSIPDAVKASGIGRTNMYGAIKRGELPAKKMGRRTIILRSDLEAFVTSLPDRATTKS